MSSLLNQEYGKLSIGGWNPRVGPSFGTWRPGRGHGGLGDIVVHRPGLILPRGAASGTPPSLPHPDAYYTRTAEGAGELGAEAIAAAVTARTGVETTAHDIFQRSIRHGMMDPEAVGPDVDRVKLVLSSIIVSARGQPQDFVQPLMQLGMNLPGGLGQAIKLMWAIDKAGLGEATASAGYDVLRAFVNATGPALLDLGRRILGGLNLTGSLGSAVFDWLSDTVGAAADEIAKAIPVMSAIFKTALGVAELVMSLLPATSGRTLHLDKWTREMTALYVRLGNPPGAPVLQFNPFFQEMFIRGGTAFVPVRALEARYWGLPDWRETFSGPEAVRWADRGDLALRPEVADVDRFHTHDAQYVLGCCTGFGTQRPWRWNLDDVGQKRRLSASILAAAYLKAGSPGCVWGIGAWDNQWRAHLKNCETFPSDPDPEHAAYCYMDAREYDIGVETVWPARGGRVGWLATWDVGRGGPVVYPYRTDDRSRSCDKYSDARVIVGYVNGQPQYAETLSDRVRRDRSELDRLLVAARAGWMPLASIPAEAMPRLGPDPHKDISVSFRTSSTRITLPRNGGPPAPPDERRVVPTAKPWTTGEKALAAGGAAVLVAAGTKLLGWW